MRHKGIVWYLCGKERLFLVKWEVGCPSMQVPLKTGCFVSQHDVMLGVYAPINRSWEGASIHFTYLAVTTQTKPAASSVGRPAECLHTMTVLWRNKGQLEAFGRTLTVPPFRKTTLQQVKGSLYSCLMIARLPSRRKPVMSRISTNSALTFFWPLTFLWPLTPTPTLTPTPPPNNPLLANLDMLYMHKLQLDFQFPWNTHLLMADTRAVMGYVQCLGVCWSEPVFLER